MDTLLIAVDMLQQHGEQLAASAPVTAATAPQGCALLSLSPSLFTLVALFAAVCFGCLRHNVSVDLSRICPTPRLSSIHRGRRSPPATAQRSFRSLPNQQLSTLWGAV